jgi:hypothetical protein
MHACSAGYALSHEITLKLRVVVNSRIPEFYHLYLDLHDLGLLIYMLDRLCGLVVRVLSYRSGGPGSIPGTTRKNSSGSGTGSTQPHEYN